VLIEVTRFGGVTNCGLKVNWLGLGLGLVGVVVAEQMIRLRCHGLWAGDLVRQWLCWGRIDIKGG
jgi:hypothetical protein